MRLALMTSERRKPNAEEHVQTAAGGKGQVSVRVGRLWKNSPTPCKKLRQQWSLGGTWGQGLEEDTLFFILLDGWIFF